MEKQISEITKSLCTPHFYYEPIQVPKVDRDGNTIGYESPLVVPCSLNDSDKLRQKTACNQRGLTADRNNPTGFRALLDLINQCKDMTGSSVIRTDKDDLEVVTQVKDIANKVKKYSENHKSE